MLPLPKTNSFLKHTKRLYCIMIICLSWGNGSRTMQFSHPRTSSRLRESLWAEREQHEKTWPHQIMRTVEFSHKDHAVLKLIFLIPLKNSDQPVEAYCEENAQVMNTSIEEMPTWLVKVITFVDNTTCQRWRQFINTLLHKEFKLLHEEKINHITLAKPLYQWLGKMGIAERLPAQIGKTKQEVLLSLQPPTDETQNFKY